MYVFFYAHLCLVYNKQPIINTDCLLCMQISVKKITWQGFYECEQSKDDVFLMSQDLKGEYSELNEGMNWLWESTLKQKCHIFCLK